MSLLTTVYLSGVNNLSDARYSAGMGVDYLGFHLDSSHSDYISPESFKEITGWVSGPKFVGILTQYDAGKLDHFNVDALEVSYPEPLPSLDIPVFLRIDCNEYPEFPQIMDTLTGFEAVILEGNGEEFLKRVLNLSNETPILLDGEITTSNVLDLIRNHKLEGLVLKGGDEVRPGYREFDELADILETLESE